jgi:uncharacterized lipoprotein NlpE involved in copper resistance
LKFKFCIILLYIAVFCLACNNNDSKSDRQKVDNIIGIYNGIIPCSDCKGINYIISLNIDSTYILSMEYIGKPEERNLFTSSGFWTIENHNVKLLNKYDGNYLFKISKSSLMMLDMNGNIMKNNEKYLLKKK